MLTLAVPYWQIILAAVVGFIVGGSWYMPMFFGKSWMKHTGVKPKDMAGKKWPAYVMAFIGQVLTAFVLALILSTAGVSSLGGAVLIAALAWIGFCATSLLSRHLWEGAPQQLFVINASQYLVTYVLMAVILVL